MPANLPLSRRRFLGLSASSQVTAALSYGVFADSHGITPITGFYRQQLGTVPPLAAADWSIYVDGFVARPRTWNAADLRAVPRRDTVCTIACAGLNDRNSLIGTARWCGVRLGDLLMEAGVGPRARFVQFTAQDGFRTSLPLEQAADALLASEMNGQPLPPEHGYPLRLVAPGLYGYKMPKWIHQITLTSAPLPGYWESRGWPEDGQVSVLSCFFEPAAESTQSGPIRLSGAAFAGTQAVAQVQVSADDGPWMPVDFTPAPAGQWTLWRQMWQPPAPGVYALRVRAADASGRMQADEGGGHSIRRRLVRVTE